MYKNQVCFAFIAFMVSLLIMIFLQLCFEINHYITYSNVSSEIITLFSILLGFNMLGLSVFLPSKQASKLYLKAEKNNQGGHSNLLNRVIKFFTDNLILSFMCIVLFLSIKAVPKLENILAPIIIPLLITTFYSFYLSIDIFIKIYKNNRSAD